MANIADIAVCIQTSSESIPSTRGTVRGDRTAILLSSQTGRQVLIQKNGDCEVEASFTEHEVASSNASGLTYCNIEWKQQPDKRRK